jgi:hypothetical protein
MQRKNARVNDTLLEHQNEAGRIGGIDIMPLTHNLEYLSFDLTILASALSTSSKLLQL